MMSGARRTEGYRMPVPPSLHCTLTWRKSNFSQAGGDCVEIACAGPSVLVRDSHRPSGDVLAFTPAQWSVFVRRIRNDELGTRQG